MADFAYDPDICFDPDHPENIVRDAPIELYDAIDTSGTLLLALKDTTGLPLPNPLPSNEYGVIPRRIASVPQMMWKSGDFSGFFSSYKGLRDEAVAAREAAEEARAAAEIAGTNAATAAAAQLATATEAVTESAAAADTSATAAATAQAAALAAQQSAEAAAAASEGGGIAVDPIDSDALILTTKADGSVSTDPVDSDALIITV